MKEPDTSKSSPRNVARRVRGMPKNYLYFWETFTLYATVLPARELHTHTTASITISLDGDFSFERASVEPQPYQAVFVPPGVEHRETTPGLRRLVLQLEGGSPLYYTLGPLLESAEPVALDPAAFHVPLEEVRRAAAPAFEKQLRPEEARQLFLLCLRAVTGVTEPVPGGIRDERIKKTLRWLRSLDELPTGLTASHLAASVDLSTERFRHVFKDTMGLPVRRYLLWLRIRRAGAAVATGVSLTEAAHAAGFYDSAHLSRTCKEMLGFPPSFLTSHRVELVNCTSDES